jgi:hypothetical protein
LASPSELAVGTKKGALTFVVRSNYDAKLI